MRIGILGNEGSWYVDQLCRAVTAHGHQPFFVTFPQLQAEVIGGVATVRAGELDLSTLDVLIVRTMPPGSLEEVVVRMDVLATLEQLGVRLVNPAKAMECAIDKYLTTQRLAAAGLRVPDTIVCECSDQALDAFDRLGGDVVVKPLFGSEGRGLLRVSDPDIALRVFRTLERIDAVLYLQRFLNGPPSDIRILLLDGEPIASMKRTPAAGDFRANAAQKGTSQPHQPDDQEMTAALQAAEITGCPFSGIDLMYDADERLHVIEVNAVPGWRAIQKTCHVAVANHFVRWLER